MSKNKLETGKALYLKLQKVEAELLDIPENMDGITLKEIGCNKFVEHYSKALNSVRHEKDMIEYLIKRHLQTHLTDQEFIHFMNEES
jgi:hypothetical protein